MGALKLTTTTIKGLNKMTNTITKKALEIHNLIMKPIITNKSITFNAIEKGILQDILTWQVKKIIKEQEKHNKQLKKKGLLSEYESINNLDKYDCKEFEYIEMLEKIKDKLKLSIRQNKILDKRYNK